MGGWALSLLCPKGLVHPPLHPSVSRASGLFGASPGGRMSLHIIPAFLMITVPEATKPRPLPWGYEGLRRRGMCYHALGHAGQAKRSRDVVAGQHQPPGLSCTLWSIIAFFPAASCVWRLGTLHVPQSLNHSFPFLKKISLTVRLHIPGPTLSQSFIPPSKNFFIKMCGFVYSLVP